ncbi:glycosyltransferase [Streptococcus loxodontisalivarius]|uniref:1,2-diacylglycerol-3-alpha-glucose alpha-1,2-glucosyltransferase n=1 Tax=Streptococcus loxodontisalivarius TaxID=1349415 RepID=A0ABS2PQM3_9STRE|nr:glycosyltransferase [Streptococcus loxodontisalivarius]MBM7642342.1 1,2-diacylglycerol-3-alpha-glucose alpha-1,2-glucosyltransferase [Streptococcus loxodontisalivarius]
MKVLLYLEGEKAISKSGIGRAIKHQQRALESQGIPYTTDEHDDYDLVHINTYGLMSWHLLKTAKRSGKKVIMHGHSTKEDFRNSFILSNQIAPLFKWYLMHFYRAADAIITPTEYSKSLIQSYGITCPIYPVSNGIDLAKYVPDKTKEEAFREYFQLKEGQKVVISAGLYFKRKGIEDFVKVAESMPDVTFIWFGQINKMLIPAKIRRLVEKNHPSNVIFPGYIKGDIYEGAMSGADAFFFPSLEETEGIVVLEALASHQHLVLRDIPVYEGWIGQDAVEFASDVPGFVSALRKVLSGQSQKEDAGYAVAQSRRIELVAQQLADVYQKVMED